MNVYVCVRYGLAASAIAFFKYGAMGLEHKKNRMRDKLGFKDNKK